MSIFDLLLNKHCGKVMVLEASNFLEVMRTHMASGFISVETLLTFDPKIFVKNSN